jgi:hypothetical protein
MIGENRRTRKRTRDIHILLQGPLPYEEGSNQEATPGSLA